LSIQKRLELGKEITSFTAYSDKFIYRDGKFLSQLECDGDNAISKTELHPKYIKCDIKNFDVNTMEITGDFTTNSEDKSTIKNMHMRTSSQKEKRNEELHIQPNTFIIKYELDEKESPNRMKRIMENIRYIFDRTFLAIFFLIFLIVMSKCN